MFTKKEILKSLRKYNFDMDETKALLILKLRQIGVSDPEIKKYSGEIIYIDNRAPITRTASQKEEVKIVIEF